MKVILKEPIKRLGDRGQTVEVADGYARNYLIPGGKAFFATADNLKRYEAFRRAEEKKCATEKQAAEETAKRLQAVSCTITVQAHEEQLYGSVTSADIVTALAQEGFVIDKKAVLLEEPIKQLGVFSVAIRLHPDVIPQVKVWVVQQ